MSTVEDLLGDITESDTDSDGDFGAGFALPLPGADTGSSGAKPATAVAAPAASGSGPARLDLAALAHMSDDSDSDMPTPRLPVVAAPSDKGAADEPTVEVVSPSQQGVDGDGDGDGDEGKGSVEPHSDGASNDAHGYSGLQQVAPQAGASDSSVPGMGAGASAAATATDEDTSGASSPPQAQPKAMLRVASEAGKSLWSAAGTAREESTPGSSPSRTAATRRLFDHFASQHARNGGEAALSVDDTMRLLRAAKMIDGSLSVAAARQHVQASLSPTTQNEAGERVASFAAFERAMAAMAAAKWPSLSSSEALARVHDACVVPTAARLERVASQATLSAPRASSESFLLPTEATGPAPPHHARHLSGFTANVSEDGEDSDSTGLPPGSPSGAPSSRRQPLRTTLADLTTGFDEDGSEDSDGDGDDDAARESAWEQNMSNFAASAVSHPDAADGMPFAQHATDVPARGLRGRGRRRADSGGSGRGGQAGGRGQQAPGSAPGAGMARPAGAVPGRYSRPTSNTKTAFGGEADRGAWRKHVGGYTISTTLTDDDKQNMSFRPKINKGYRFDGDNLDFATRQEVAEERRKLRLMQLRQVAWEAEEAARREAMGVSGGSRRLLRKTGLARETQQDAILRLYNSHAKKQAKPPPPAVDPKTGQPLFQPVINHRPPPVPPSARRKRTPGADGAGAALESGDASVTMTPRTVGADTVITTEPPPPPRVTATSQRKAAQKLYENAMAKLDRQHDIVQIQQAMDRAVRNSSKVNRTSRDLLRRKIAKEVCAVVTTLGLSSTSAVEALRGDEASAHESGDNAAGYWASPYVRWAREKLDFPQLTEVLRRLGFIRTTDKMVAAVEAGSSPWPWATVTEQSMMLRLWAALVPNVDLEDVDEAQLHAQAATAATGGLGSTGGPRAGNWVYAARLLALLQAVMTGDSDVTLQSLDAAGRWVLEGPSALPGDRRRGRRAPASVSSRVPRRWGATRADDEGDDGRRGGVPQGGVGPASVASGPGAKPLTTARGEAESKAKHGADRRGRQHRHGPAGRGRGEGAFADMTDSDTDGEMDLDVNLASLSELTQRNAAKLQRVKAAAAARDAAAAASGGTRLPLDMNSIMDALRDDTGGAGAATPAPSSHGAGSVSLAEPADAGEPTPQDLADMGVGVVWSHAVLQALAELRTSRVAVVGAKVNLKDAHLDAATVASVVGPATVAGSVTGAPGAASGGTENHTFAPILCDKSRRIDAKTQGGNVPRQDRLIHYAKVVQRKREEAKKQQEAKRRQQCTFKPNTSATKRYRSRPGNGGRRSGSSGQSSEPASERLYKLHTVKQAKLRRQRKRKEEADKQAEVQDCTFRPEIHPSPSLAGTEPRVRRRAPKPLGSGPAHNLPRGYAKSINRLRKGQAQRDETKKFEKRLRRGMVSRKALVRDARGNTKVEPFSLATSKRTTQRQRQRRAEEAKRRERVQFIEKAKAEAARAARRAQAQARADSVAAAAAAAAAGPGPRDGAGVGAAPTPRTAAPDMNMLMPNTFGNALVAPLMFVDVNITPQHTERIAVWEGEDVGEVAQRFASQHGLNSTTTARLATMLAAKKASVLASRA